MLRRHWRIVAVTTLLSLLLGVAHYVLTTKEFRAKTTLQIERRQVSALTGDFNPWIENLWSMEYYPTQYRLLQSRDLAARVVRDLRLWEDPTFAPARASLPTNPDGSVPSPADDEAALGSLARRLLGGLEVNPVRNTQLVDISYRSPSPQLSARVANGIADAFVDWGIETRTESASKASVFLGSQIETLKQEIQDRENDLQKYSQSTDIIDLDNPATNISVRRLDILNRDYAAAVSDRIEKQARFRELQGTTRDALADSLEGSLASQERSKLLDLEREYEAKLKIYKPEWPAMLSLKGEIDSLRRSNRVLVDEQLTNEVEFSRGEYQAALRREQSLKNEFQKAKNEAIEDKSAAVEYNNLKVEVSTRRALLDDLLRRQSGTEVTSRLQATRESNVRVVDRALVPGGAFRPSLRNNLSLGIGFGILFGALFILLIEYLDRTIKTAEEVERLLGIGTLAVIPDISDSNKRYGYGYGYSYGYGIGRKKKEPALEEQEADDDEFADSRPREIELLPQTRPRLAVSEAYRALRTALLLSSAEELKIVAVTSANSGEGKTATSSNLAVVMAQLGRRVLLVDGDMRKPRTHRIFRVPNRVGLVNFLTGTSTAQEIFFPTTVPNLFLTPSGPIPPNPSELLASEKMREFLTHIRADFDFVILDTPPVLAVTDSTLMGSLADGVVLCLRAGVVQREDAKLCRNRLDMADVRLLGAVLNRYRARQSRYGKQYSNYYQTYGADDQATGTAA